MNFWERNNFNDNGNSDVYDKMNEFSGKSESQLSDELTYLVGKMKADGTFNPDELVNLYNTAYPYLNDYQRERMKDIINNIIGG